MKQMYKPIIGLEVHVELKTKQKMFCGCPTDNFGKEPNTLTCPTCLGLPGALPFTNQEAIKMCAKIGLALNCQLAEKSLFERKNYFYPDLPKGYQISQYRWPLCTNGFLMVADKTDEKRKIRINRVHQEEDTGKLLHPGDQTLIDYNRSGVPLVEVVTEPDFTDTEQVKNYAKLLAQIFRELEVSNAEMEKGDMRLEANVSVSPPGSEGLPNYRVELKNINSFTFMASAITYEIERQIKVLESGEKITQHTRGWDEVKKETFVQREKEEANDYRYFPEPDLPELRIKNLESRIKQEIPELPNMREERLVQDYGLPSSSSATLSASKELAILFEDSVLLGKSKGITPLEISNLLLNVSVKNRPKDSLATISTIEQSKSGIIDDNNQLEVLAGEVITENRRLVESYKSGKVTVIMALVGMVMRKTAGKADPLKTKTILEKLLQS
ncbi:MAG: Asp-tRNA(Asn)/Glu-tRNA(Gln) amidotransferase subunit GatB [Candidatus Daviesbacteria bacterium]|nr:Asp-tRNA(Asn)/Glu-tRNA(Gln) amidotransferase subunit GatB [Candidatus Daviesbacteria bacterium]